MKQRKTLYSSILVIVLIIAVAVIRLAVLDPQFATTGNWFSNVNVNGAPMTPELLTINSVVATEF